MQAGGDGFDAERFVQAQQGVIDRALAELAAGRKRSHWMWFIFPQLAGLGRSAAAQHYALAGLDEARAYLAHPLLGRRLIECTEAVNRLPPGRLEELFGTPDDLKFCSCMTLFEQVAGAASPFSAAIGRWCGGRRCARTLEMLGGEPGHGPA